MLLRKISLHGFKSFPDRLEVSFEPGITAIVGPNGSGKSNLGDAVKWVLGEANARELRGARMEDVIFAGSAQRRSLGLAEVTLTLDNHDGFLPVDFTEVSVTRRLYRSGESEFLLNHTPCRLRDVQELFLDSGVGRNAYALLSQAEIEAVLSPQPEARRRLFEEAAGVAKFRARKAEALRKLADTEQNLARAGDVLGEITSRLGPLKEKARRARRHAELSEELRRVEVALLAGQLQEAQRRMDDAGEELARCTGAVARGLGMVRQAEAGVAEARLALTQVETDREEAAREVLALATELEKAEGQLKMAGERRERWREELERLRSACAELDRRQAEAVARVAGQEAAGATEEEELATVRLEVAERGERFAQAVEEVRRREAELERKKNAVIERIDEAAQLRNELRGLEASREAAEGQRSRLRRNAAEAQEAREAAQRAATEAERRVKAAQEAAAERQGNLQRCRTAAEEAKAALRQLEGRQRQSETELARLRSRHQVLSDWQKQREGYAEGPRAVLAAQAAGRLQGVLGTVADLLRVPAELERAIETALGGGLQDVVVVDEGAARQGIAYLKERAAGRATFLPLALLAPRPLSERERQELASVGGEGFLGVADRLVGYSPHIRPAVEYLLGRVLVARDLETALRVGRASGLRYLVVTTEGDVVRPGGAVTGGREERSRGLLRRQRELAELEEALRRAEEERRRLAEEFARAGEQMAALGREEAKREAEWRAAAGEVVEAQRRAAVAAAELGQAEAAVERIQRELIAVTTGVGGNGEEGLRTRLAAVETQRRELEEAVARETEALREALRQRDTAAEALTEVKIRLAECEKDAAAARADLNRARAEAEGVRREAAAAGERRTELEGRLREAETWAADLERNLAELGRKRAVAEDRAEALARERAERASALAEAELAAERARQRMEEAQAAQHEAELQATRAELEAENLAARLSAEWGIGREEALKLEAVSPEGRAAAAEEAETLRRRLKALGGVDPESIAEYEALTERHAFLSQQYEDLSEARRRLGDVLTEIETTTQRRFAETFTAVRREFKELFQRVFGGGRAELRLDDPEHPADSGIEIEAQPPGKKNQSLLSLSSGERTMTALALLFALMRVRPAPFCVLDEVDAALDEANLDRFAGLLREFAATMQFVVITHRRPTMETAGVLYGVTMSEPGTSRLVSVRLAEV